MSNDPSENLHGSDSQELADVTADTARAGAERAASTPAYTSDEAPAPRSALSSFEEILSGTTHEADAPTADETTETLADDGAQDLQETLVSSTPLVTTDEAEASPAALTTDAAAAAQTTAETTSDIAPETATPQAAPQQRGNERQQRRRRPRAPAARRASPLVPLASFFLREGPRRPRPGRRPGPDLHGPRDRRGPPRQHRPGLPRPLAERDPGPDGPPRPCPFPDPRGPRGAAGRPHRGRPLALAGRAPRGPHRLGRADPRDESLTIRQNILAPLSATGSVADWDNLVGALQITGLAQRVNLRPSELSEWERFKALIARAIVSGAEVFLIEDPVSLPATAREELGPLLRSLADAGCAVVIATPNAEVAAASDRAILLTNGRVALDAPNPSAAIIAASQEANPEDPTALLGPIPSALPASFDEVVSPTGSASAPAWHPLDTSDEAGAQTSDAQQASEPEETDPAEAALDAATTRVAAAPAQTTQSTEVPQASPEPRTETAMRGIPVVEAEDPALAEPEVSDLVVRARKILSDLPGSIAPQE